MDCSKFRAYLTPYMVLVPDLTAEEVQDLSDRLEGAEAMSTESDLDSLQNYRLWNEAVEFGHHHSHVLFPIIGAVGALDGFVDKVKKWLATRPDDRIVKIYAPDNRIVLVAKRGKVIETEPDEIYS
jgi:hypothetical protein